MKLLLDKTQAADALSISVSTLERLVRDKKLRELKQGSRCVYRVSDLEQYVESLAVGEFEPSAKKRAGRPRLAV